MFNEWIKSILYILLVSVFVDIISSTLVLNKFIKLVMGVIVIIVIIRPICRMVHYDTIDELLSMINKVEVFEKEYEKKYEDYNPEETYMKYIIEGYEKELETKLTNYVSEYMYKIEKINIVTNKNLDDITEIKIYLRKEKDDDIKNSNDEYKIYKQTFDEIKVKDDISRIINISNEKIRLYIS